MWVVKHANSTGVTYKQNECVGSSLFESENKQVSSFFVSITVISD